jgi:hypothetical protein
MTIGQFYEANSKKIKTLSDDDWRVAIKKCQDHVRWKLQKRTLFGAHTEKRLGMNPSEYYANVACEKIIGGFWEWKSGFTLSQQIIRVADSEISKEVEKSKTNKAQSLKIDYTENIEFYEKDGDFDQESEGEFQLRVDAVEKAVIGDAHLEELWTYVKEGYKRSEIAELMDLKLKQFDKLKEKLIERARKNTTTKTQR